MAKEKDNRVDAEVRAELAEFKSDINSTIIDSITKGFKEIKSQLSELFNKDIDHIKETQDRHSDHHEKHFDEISKMKDMLIEYRTIDKTKSKIDEVSDRKKGIKYVILGIVIAVIGIIAGFLM